MTKTVFAPATVANVAVGFDVLGFAMEGAGDVVSLEPNESHAGVQVKSIAGVVSDLPREPERNTASVAVLALLEDHSPGHGLDIAIRKGIPLGSGMGGSAASAVGAVVAANEFLASPLPRAELLAYAAAGERAASGAPHADNVAPCLLGGLTAIVGTDPLDVQPIPVPEGLFAVLVHPHLRIDTREARGVLSAEVSLADHVQQSMKLAGLLAGCFRSDLELIRRSLADLIVEPQRSKLIPGFARARTAALEADALGFGIAGSGPSVFAWVASREIGDRVAAGVREVFAAEGIASEHWVSPVNRAGARLIDETES